MTERTIRLGEPVWSIDYPDRMNQTITAAVKLAGGRWHSRHRRWEITPSPTAAVALRALTEDHGFTVVGGDIAALAGDRPHLAALATAVDYPLDDLLDVAAPVLHDTIRRLKPHQRAAVAYILAAQRVIVADTMGLGKTIEALVALAILGCWPVVTVVPRKLLSNWAIESRLWLPDRRVAVVLPPSASDEDKARFLSRGVGAHVGEPRPGADLYVVPYSVLTRQVSALARLNPAGLVLDESQTCKTPLRHRVCQRCRAAVVDVDDGLECKGVDHHRLTEQDTVLAYKTGVVDAANTLADTVPAANPVLALSGTPDKNRVTDLISQLDIIGRLDVFGGRTGFITRHAHGIDPDAGDRSRYRKPARTEELHVRLISTCMVRRTTIEVLGLAPPDRRRMFVDLEGEGAARYREAAADIESYLSARAAELAKQTGLDPGSEALLARLRAERGKHLVRLGTLLRVAGEAKVPLAVDWAKDFLRETDRKLVIVAKHHAVVRPIAAALGCPWIDGDTGDPEPTKDRFQTDPKCRTVVLGIAAGGVGLTLTAARDMLFVEMDWTPGDLDQAEGRCYGRVNDPHPITATYLLAAGTEDERQWALVDAKRSGSAGTLDGVDLAAAWYDTWLDRLAT